MYYIILICFCITAIIGSITSAYANSYFKKHCLEVKFSNDKMNTAYDLDDFYKYRSVLINRLTKMKSFERMVKNNPLNEKPSKLLKMLKENERRLTKSTITRMFYNYKELSKSVGKGTSRLYMEQINKHINRLTEDERSQAWVYFHQLKEYENLVGKIEEADILDGHSFERWCADLLIKNNFIQVEVTRGSGDQGVDITAAKEGVRYAIQCKCYSSDLSNKPVQEVYAGKEMYGCQVGVVMTNRYFTAGAKELAEKTRVLLWDRDKLIEMLK